MTTTSAEGDWDELRARSEELASDLAAEESVLVNRRLFEHDPSVGVHATRYGTGLLRTGNAAAAAEVFEAVLEHHPDHPFAEAKLIEAKHAARQPPPKAAPSRAGRSGVATQQPEAWIKAMHGDGPASWPVKPGDESWVSDAGLIKDGQRVYRADGQPANEPTWRVGEYVGAYFGGTYVVPILLEIIAPPVFDPARVARESEDQADGERWPWLTEVRVLDVRDLADAPRLSALDIETTSMMRRTRLALGQDRRRLLLEAFGRG